MIDYRKANLEWVEPYYDYSGVVREDVESFHAEEIKAEAKELLKDPGGELWEVLEELHDGDITEEEAYERAYAYVLDHKVEEALEHYF